MSIEVEEQTARFLLDIKAVKLSPNAPFTWTSGWHSPIYCDNRITLSYPEIRSYIKDALVRGIKDNFSSVNAIAGVATAGIAQGALIADAMKLPFAYIRPEPKQHGMKNRIEGRLPAGSKVVVIEDLISTGGSSLKAVKALKEEGYDVLGLAAIFTYGFDLAMQQFNEAGCKVITLSNYNTLLKVALAMNFLENNDIRDLNLWRENPGEWKQR